MELKAESGVYNVFLASIKNLLFLGSNFKWLKKLWRETEKRCVSIELGTAMFWGFCESMHMGINSQFDFEILCGTPLILTMPSLSCKLDPIRHFHI